MRRPRDRMIAGVGALALLAAPMAPSAAYPRPGLTERVSVASDGVESNSVSFRATISADGRHAAFVSPASNLVPDTHNVAGDIFVHHSRTGTTERVSVASDGAEANGWSLNPALSADGRYVAFESVASNLVPGEDNDIWDVFVHDRQTGITERVSVSSDGGEANGWSERPVLSADGRYVAFVSEASNLVPADDNDSWDVFVRDRQTGVTERVSVASDGTEGNGSSRVAAISADGRYVAFGSLASNLVPDDGNGAWDVFVHDRETGETERVSMTSEGLEGNAASLTPSISADGRHVAFNSDASNFVPRDRNGIWDVFVHDRQTGTTERVSVASDGVEANGWSVNPTLSADGRHVAFESLASNLAPDDQNDTWDVFVHDRQTGVTEQVSVSTDGAAGDGTSNYHAISADGRHVAFDSFAANLIPDDGNGTWDVFVRDRGPATGVGALAAQQTPDGLAASGWATFSGATVTSVGDPSDDGEDLLGAEITGASVTYRVEEEDVLLRLRVASLPDGGRPGVLYRWRLTVEDADYEVRVLTAAATAVPPTVEPYFALYACDVLCTETATLSGGVGTTATEVRVALPLGAVGAQPGATLSAITASAGLGEATTGSVVILDEVAVPDTVVPVPRVDLGIAPAFPPGADVDYTSGTDLAEGWFSGTLDVAALDPGEYVVWARACLGELCGAHALELQL